MSKEQHETVGRLFSFCGARYRCFRYEEGNGFWMRLVDDGDNVFSNRVKGYEGCVSERAIGRTYHRVYNDDSYEEHNQPCDCHVCKDAR